jgi:amino acid adenylation domain-containing protein
MLVHRFLDDSASRTPDAIALIEPGRHATYEALRQLTNQFANLVRGAGVSPGDRVVIALDNSIEFVASYLGVMKAGGVAVPLPAGPRSDRLSSAIADCAPRVCIVDQATAHGRSIRNALAGVSSVLVAGRMPIDAPGNFVALLDALTGQPTDGEESPRIDIDLAAIIYTSGSTGEPRGVMLTHRNIAANTQSIVSYLGLTSRDRVMCVLPFFYVYGLSLLHTHLAVGGSLVIDNRFAFPNLVLEAMQRHTVTGFAGVPSTFALLLDKSSVDAMTFPALRYVTQAGGAMSPARVREWLAKGPQVPFLVMYGATEASARLTYLPPADLLGKLGSIGRPIPNVEISVRTDDGSAAAPNVVGELVARGTNIAVGYWNRPEETSQKFGPFGYRTGDLGYMDDDGFLFLIGRRSDMIKVGAHRVGPKEIEDVIGEHPAIREAAVIGVAHDLLGEAPLAYITPRDGVQVLDIEELQAFCRSRLPSHKVPVQFVICADLPKLPGVGKIDKQALKSAGTTVHAIAARV